MFSKADQIATFLRKIPSTIDQRGRSLQQDVYLVSESDGQYLLLVKGSYKAFYNVQISLQPGLDEWDAVNCNCPYAEDHLYCKHIAAALHFLSDSQLLSGPESIRAHKKATSAKQKKANERQPIVLPAEAAEDPEAYLQPLRNLGAVSRYRVSEYALEPDHLSIKIHQAYSIYDRPVTATISWKDGRYEMECNQHSHKGICDHISCLVEFILQQEHANLLAIVPAEAQRNAKREALAKLGVTKLSDQELESLADLFLYRGNLLVEPRGKLKGLSAPENISKFVDTLLSQQLSYTQKLQQLQPAVEAETPQLPGFILFLNDSFGTLEGVKGICGKPNKARSAITAHHQYLRTPYARALLQVPHFTQAFLLAERINEDLRKADHVPSFRELQQLFRYLPGMAVYRYESTSLFYEGSDGFPPFRKAEIKACSVAAEPLRLHFEVCQHDGFVELKACLTLGKDTTIDVEASELNLYSRVLAEWNKNSVGLMNSPKEGLALQHFLDLPQIKVVETEKQAFMETVVIPLAREFPVRFEGLETKTEALSVQQWRLYVDEHQQHVSFRPVMLYEGNQEINVLDEGSLLQLSEDQLLITERNPEEEESYLSLLESVHPTFKNGRQQTFFTLSLEEMQQDFWFLKAFEKLKQQGVHIFGLNKLKNFNYSPHLPAVKLNMKSSHDWFETELIVAYGDMQVKLKDLKKAVKEGKEFIELSDGSLGILPEEWLKKFALLFRSGQISKGQVRVPKTQFGLLEDVIEPGQHAEIIQELEEKKARLRHFTGLKESPVPKRLKASLRPYQQEGLNWLNFLNEFGWGGILADDMGLGKTLQAIAFICQQLEQNPKLPNLVVAPTTLLFNWRNELEKFAPTLKYYIHHGQRQQKNLGKHQLILTSYGVLVNDLALFKDIPFNLLIADESQAFKNVHSKRYKAMVQLQGRLRLAMTGTPIENNLFELYAQMNFANPAFFGEMAAFRDNYVKPIQQQQHEQLRDELKRKISPFLLRRTKKQVLTELPDKTEDYLYCSMHPAQRKCYDAYRNEYREYLLNKFDQEGVEKSQMYVLEGLTRLRQICDAPQLVDAAYKSQDSAKLQELLLHVQEKTGNHKLLIFSQYVKMLSLVKKEFEKLDIAYAYLDGKTSVKEREKQVNFFQENNDCRVFLISLKAGGSGLNLTAADYVYLLDPWWNPAVENQAIDRAYRMGQEKKVIAYRMLCENTVEEKILKLQQTKKQLSDDIVGGGEGMLSRLNREAILELFS